MEGHAPFPNPKQPQKIVRKVVKAVKQRKTESPTDDDAKYHVKTSIVELIDLPFDASVANPRIGKQPKYGEGQKIHEAVPVNLE